MKEATETARTGAAKDGRGRPAALLDPYMLRLRRQFDVIPQEALDGINADLGSGMRKSIRVMFAISLVCVSIGLIALIDYGYQWYSGSISFSFLRRKLFGTVIIWYGPIIIWAGAKRHRMQKVVHVMLDHLRCPHCGYDLRLLPPDPADGATVCPECGHAWRLNASSTGHTDA